MHNTLSTAYLLQRWGTPLAIILLCLIIALAGKDFSILLRYERNEIFNGQLYRLLSGHIVHLGWSHLVVNLLGLIIISLLFSSFFSWQHWLLIFIICAFGTSLGLLIFNPEVIWYIGLSGVLHGMFVAGVIKSINKFHYYDLILLALIVLKLIWEQLSGPLPGSEFLSQGNVIIDAHLYGAITGLLLSMLFRTVKF